jgi:drug/metabolite transporter (DMT)-like permease
MAIPRAQAPDMTGANRDAARVLAFALFPITLFALTPVTMRIVVGELDPLFAGAVRTAGAIVVTLPLALILRFALPRDRIGWRLLLLNAGLTFTAFPLLFALGGQFTSASHAALIMASTPIITGLCVAVLERQRPRRTWWMGCAVAFAGEAVLILLRDPAHAGGASTFGDLLIFCACIGSGTGYIASARLSLRIGVWPGIFWSVTLASLAQLPLVALRWRYADWSAVDAAGWAALLHLTYGATVIAILAWTWALARGGVARVAVLQFAQPVIGLALAAVLLGERITPPLLAAAVFILAGVVIARRR